MEIWTSWSKTSHAKAYETLVKKGNAREKECLYCHTTDFSGDMNKEFLKGVQCEACHGMGDNHLKDELKMRQYGQIQQYRCKRCHIPSRDKDFDYERDKLKSH
jgi:hypothetical protein